ncbi:MAG: ABC transporter ATP-binding protein [Dehalococcoidales bacterium]|nr:MAG: ABC transporter ATP-binding protein [Dehalococcoidales bacterium]
MASSTAPAGQQLRGALDAGDTDEILGKIYDAGILKRIIGYLADVKWHLAIGAVGIILRTAANLVTPLLVAMATNRIFEGNIDGLTIAVLLYLGVLALVWFAQYLETLHLSYTAQGILFKMRTGMFKHLHELSLSFFDHNKVGKLMSRVQNDVDQLQMLVSQNIIMVGVNSITLIGIFVIMLTMNWQLALLSLSTIPVLVTIVIIWQRYARKAFILARRAIAMVNDNLQESISGVRVTQNLSREKENVKLFDEVNKANLEANKKAALLQALINPLTQILTDGSYVIVLIFGGFQVLEGSMPVGFLLAFLLYIQRIGQPIQQLATMYTEIQRAMASGARIFELIDVQPEIEDSVAAKKIVEAKGEIEFKDVNFEYIPGSEIIHSLNLKINSGEIVAIAGRTGAGKSSIASLINRFYEVTSGEITLDGTNISNITQDSLRKQIALVPQDPFLFSGTIEDNILDGKLDASHDEMTNAAKIAGAHDIISKMEKGYQTEVGERGGNLSPGQRQLVCLARAILSDPAILILDEATANIDTNTEKIIQQSLYQLAKGRTCIIIAHRLSTITNVDRIIVLEHGNIVETGNHRELMARKGLYYNMFETLSRTGEDDDQ